MFFVTKATIIDSCDLGMQALFYIGVAADSLQGAIVALIFCLLNSEVSNEPFFVKLKFIVVFLLNQEKKLSPLSPLTTLR